MARFQDFRAFNILDIWISRITRYIVYRNMQNPFLSSLHTCGDAGCSYVTLQIWKYTGNIRNFITIFRDFKICDFNKISKLAVQDFKGVADPLVSSPYTDTRVLYSL